MFSTYSSKNSLIRRYKLEIESIPKTKGEKISITYGCVGFIDSYRFLASSLDCFVTTLVDRKNKPKFKKIN